MNIIKIVTFSKEAASKDKGIILETLLEPYLINGEIICVDFSGITYFATPFFNNSFAKLALIYGFDAVFSIQIKNISKVGYECYQSSMENARSISQ